MRNSEKDSSIFISLDLLLSRYLDISKYLSLFLESLDHILSLLKRECFKILLISLSQVFFLIDQNREYININLQI